MIKVFVAALAALVSCNAAHATTYLMDWSASGTGHRYSGGPHPLNEDITVTSVGHGSFTIDETSTSSNWRDYLTAFDLVTHVIDADHETGFNGFDQTLTQEADIHFDLSSLFTFSFAAGAAGQQPVIGFAASVYHPSPALNESIVGKDGVFTSVIRPENITTSATLNIMQAAAVPEPASWALMLSGFGLVGTALRRRQSLPKLG